jgi:electron transfer flavoprotein beta subunit
MPKRILVGIKQVVDANVQIRVAVDGSGVDLANLKLAMNPFDEIALEEAIRLKEAGLADEVLAVTIGAARAEDVLRTALAMGADRALHIRVETGLESLALAKLLHAVALVEEPILILLGKQAIDGDAGQTGQMLAAKLGWAQATYASKLVLEDERAVVTREIDGGSQTVELKLPAVITADLRLNQPRYAALPNIMKARKRPIEQSSPEQLSVDIVPRLTVLRTEEPARRTAGVIVPDVQSLVARLRAESVLPPSA